MLITETSGDCPEQSPEVFLYYYCKDSTNNMKLKFIYSLAFALLCNALAGEAKTVTPDEALSRANASQAVRAMSAGNAANKARPKLVYTQTTAKGAPAAYVFNYAGGKGYMILAGDDIALPVLGYNSQGSIDARALPPQLEWWLQEYARQIEYAASLGATTLQGDARPAAPQAQAVASLIKTHWDQGAPYNDKCPMLNAERTYTGCVATSMAQVMKYFNYPEVGQNSISYNDDDGCGKRLSLNFAQRRFDWDNMLDDYLPGRYNETQAEAVASLMQATGYSVKMSYAADASGALAMNIKHGLVYYFNYDPNMEYALRSYYSTTEWKQKIIDNLQNVGPVLYGGASMLGGGHSFILDGYDGNGYFHFNWGWSEMSDGYFLLEALNPSSLGAGGGAGGGYNFTQDALFGVQPPTGKPALEEPIQLTQQGSLTATIAGDTLKLALEGESQCMWVNYNPETMKINMGALFLPQSNPLAHPVAVQISPRPFQVQSGYGVPPASLVMDIPISKLNLPDGKYEVCIGTRENEVEDADWIDVRTNYGYAGTILFEKKGSAYTATTTPTAEIKIASAEFTQGLYIGCSSELKLELVNNSDLELTRGFAPILFFEDGNPGFLGESVLVSLAPGERITKTWNTGFTALSQQAAYLTAETDMVFTLYDESTGNMYTDDILEEVTLHANPGMPGLKFDQKLTLANATRSVLILDGPGKSHTRYFVNDLSDLHFESTFTLQSKMLAYPVVACVASQEGSQFAIEAYDGYTIFMSKVGEQHHFDTHVNFQQGETDKKYYFALAIIVNGNLQAVSDLTEFMVDPATGIDGPTADSKQLSLNGHKLEAAGRDIRVCNLQGVQVLSGRGSLDTATLPAGIYIARSGSETLKFTVK